MKRRNRVLANELCCESQPCRGRKRSYGGIKAVLVVLTLWSVPARAATYGVDWIDMSSVPVGNTVPSGSVFTIPGYGSVTITYTGSLNRTHDQLGAAQNVNGPLSIGSDTYQWMTFDGLFQVNPAGGSSTPLTYTITYTFSGLPVPPDELVLGVWGLGRSNQADPDLISTVTVANNGTFLGDWELGPTYGPTEFQTLPSSNPFTLRNSLTNWGDPGNPEFNTDLAVIHVSDAITVLTLNVSHIGQDGFSFSVGRKFPVVGACCLTDGSCVTAAGQGECDALGGFYWGDGSDCSPNPCVGTLLACKFEDLNGNGVEDGIETRIPGITINAFGPIANYSDITDADGCVTFANIPAGAYRVSEDVPLGMVQTAPLSVFSTVNVLAGLGVIAPEFGNQDTCETARQRVHNYPAGNKDGFSTGDGPELAAPSPTLCTFLNSFFPFGPLDDCNPAAPGNCSEFDCGVTNRGFGHTFTGWDPTSTVIHAWLNFRVRSATGGNDTFGLFQDGVGVWGAPFTTFGPWPGDLTISLNLENLPPNALGITNVLAALQDGDLDIVIQDDTEIDYLELIVITCCNCVQPPPDMVAWWPLNEAAGMAVTDIAGSISDGGTSQPAQIGGGGPTSLTAVVGTGLSFPAGISPTPGPNVYVEVPPSAEVNFGTGDFSIDAWIQLGPTSDIVYPIVDNLDYSTPAQNKGYAFFVQGGQLLLRLGPDNVGGLVAAVSNFASPMVLGQWYHVAVTVERVSPNPQVTFYLDGLQYGPVTPPGPGLNAGNNITTTTPLWIGGNSRLAGGGGTVNRGEISIDELEFFHRELTQSEVNSIWSAGICGKCIPSCDCPYQGDMNGDGFIDAVDLAMVIDIVFFGASDVQDPTCPKTRADFNADGFADAVDLALLIDHVFFGGSGPVDPCVP